jgi:uncharacterized membrane protein
MVYFLALLIGIIAGLRALTAPAAVSWAAYLGVLPLQNTWLAFLGYAVTPYIVTLLAVAELIADKLPSTPSRKAPLSFGVRIATGALSGAAIGATANVLLGGLVAGVAGAIIGTIAGYDLRNRLALTFERDLPAALIEDLAAIIGAVLIVAAAG